MKKASFIAATLGLFGALASSCLSDAAQTAPSGQENQQETVLHVETREAVIEVVARDRRNLPIADLAASEFEVYEFQEHGSRIQRRILWLRAMNPERKPIESESTKGFQVRSGAVCALDATVHYEIAIQASAEPGFHTILVRTTRAHIQLSFRRQYYVGLRRDNATPQELKRLVTPAALNEAACYHPLTPPTLAISARILDAAVGNTTRYEVVIKPESVGDVGIKGVEPRVDLDFGMCVFDDAGEVAGYLRSTIDHKLSTADITRLQDHGFVSMLETPGKEPPPLARLVVLDRNTGNLGIVDVAKPLPVAAQSKQERKKRKLIGDVRAFGAVTPSENASAATCTNSPSTPAL